MLRPSTLILSVMVAAILAFAATFADGWWLRTRQHNALQDQVSLTTQLGLTDPALFTEARYTRHPSQADRHAAFQDHPLALEHFPSGSLVSPPLMERRP